MATKGRPEDGYVKEPLGATVEPEPELSARAFVAARDEMVAADKYVDECVMRVGDLERDLRNARKDERAARLARARRAGLVR